MQAVVDAMGRSHPRALCVASAASPAPLVPSSGAEAADDLRTAIEALAGYGIDEVASIDPVATIVPEAPPIAEPSLPDTRDGFVRVALYRDLEVAILVAEIERLRSLSPLLVRAMPSIVSAGSLSAIEFGKFSRSERSQVCIDVSSRTERCETNWAAADPVSAVEFLRVAYPGVIGQADPWRSSSKRRVVRSCDGSVAAQSPLAMLRSAVLQVKAPPGVPLPTRRPAFPSG